MLVSTKARKRYWLPWAKITGHEPEQEACLIAESFLQDHPLQPNLSLLRVSK